MGMEIKLDGREQAKVDMTAPPEGITITDGSGNILYQSASQQENANSAPVPEIITDPTDVDPFADVEAFADDPDVESAVDDLGRKRQIKLNNDARIAEKHFNIGMSADWITEASDEYTQVVRDIVADKKILVISNAMENEPDQAEACSLVAEAIFDLGADEVDLERYGATVTSLDGYDVVYIMGGSITSLLSMIADTDISAQLRDFLNLKNGFLLAEKSACHVLSPSVQWLYSVRKGIEPQYEPVPKTYAGFGVTTHMVFVEPSTLSEPERELIDIYGSDPEDIDGGGSKIIRIASGDFYLDCYEPLKKYNKTSQLRVQVQKMIADMDAARRQ